jgi:hypothetical protein
MPEEKPLHISGWSWKFAQEKRPIEGTKLWLVGRDVPVVRGAKMPTGCASYLGSLVYNPDITHINNYI